MSHGVSGSHTTFKNSHFLSMRRGLMLPYKQHQQVIVAVSPVGMKCKSSRTPRRRSLFLGWPAANAAFISSSAPPAPRAAGACVNRLAGNGCMHSRRRARIGDGVDAILLRVPEAVPRPRGI